LHQIIRANQKHEIRTRKALAQFHKRISGEARAKRPFDIGRDHAPAIGNAPRARQTFRKRRHPRARLQGIARRDQQPNLIQPKRAERLARDMAMPGMGRVEGPAQKADAAPAAIAERGRRHGRIIRPK